MTTRNPTTHVIKVAVLVTDDIRPKDLSRHILDPAFEDVDEVLQFTVEGYGVDKIEDATEGFLMKATVDDALARMSDEEWKV
jgi:hypothetical protein